MSNLNKNIKIFFIDLDGTLLDIKKDGKAWISDANVEAIAKVQKEGKKVVISTGRYGHDLPKFMKRAGVEYAVGGNGAQVVDVKGKLYKDDRLTIRQSLLVIDFAKKYGLTMKLDGDMECFGAKGFVSQKLAKQFGYYPNSHYNVLMHKEYTKIVLWGKTKSKITKLGEELSKIIPNASIVTSTQGWTLEITHESSTKGLGNKFVAETFYKVKNKAEMAHLGDTLNDSTVVKYMRLIAMGNSDKKLKAMTKFIGPSYKNAGAGRIIANGEYKKVD